MFDGLSNLELLWLSDNDLKGLPSGVFDGLSNLEYLNLNYNRYPQREFELPEDVFDGLSSLETLLMDDNGVSALPAAWFDDLSNLSVLSLQENRLTTLSDDVFDNLTQLESLDLSDNGLTTLSVDWFDSLIKLERLNLGYNDLDLEAVPEDFFHTFPGLNWLGLDGIGKERPGGGTGAMTTLSYDWLDPDAFPNLRDLSLSSNDLSELPADFFGGFPKLRILYLASNQLTELPDGVFNGLSTLQALDLRSNPGTPFILTVEIEQRGENAVVVKVAKGAPFEIRVSLSVREGAGSRTVSGISIVPGSTASGEIDVTPTGDGPVTISVETATLVQPGDYATYDSWDVGRGQPLVMQQIVATENSPATGAPTISGTAQVGQTLTADTSGIADANGFTGETFSYQWLGSRDTEIQGATNATYTLVATDEGKTIKVRVTFTDDGGNEETLTSAPTGPVLREPVFGDGPPGAPRNLTVTAGDREITLSWEPPEDNGNPPATRYRIERRMDGKDYNRSHWGIARETTYTKTHLANGVTYIFRVKAENGSGNDYGPYGPPSEEVSATPTSGSAVDLGTPVLSNTKTLHHGMVRLDWEDIEDAGWYVVQYYHVQSGEWLDLPAAGVDIAFHGSSAVVSNLHGLSWLRVRAVSCAGESEWSQIEQLFGTKASDWEDVPVPEVAEGDQIDPCPVILGTPVLSEPETLHHGMVQLDWQDIEDAGWYVVQHYHVKSGEWLDLPAAGVDIAFHGSSAVVSNLHGLSWLRVRAVSCAGESEWSQIEQLFGTNASDWEGVPVPDVEEGDEIEVCPEDADTPDNSPATGAPAITGTAQVGETLSADTSGIADADGLTNATFTYQWLADDAAIAGAIGSTHTLADNDEGKVIKVTVSFTDDAGNREALTSGTTEAVAAAPTPNTPATGVPHHQRHGAGGKDADR